MAANPFDQFDEAPAAANPFDQYDAGAKRKTFGSDARNALMQGILQLPGAATGLADISPAAVGFDRPVSRAADRLGEITGFQPSKWAKDRDAQYSPATQAAMQEIDQAWDDPNKSAADVVGAYTRNPRTSALQILRSVPSMVAGGAGGKLIGGAAGIASSAVRAAIGEGAVMAGSAMDQIDSSVDPQRAAAASAATGVLGGALGGLTGKAASRLGFGDIDQAIAGGVTGRASTTLPLKARIPAGIVQEGLIEEGGQSAVETAAQNWAERKPLTEGMARNVTEGAIAGGAMGGGFAALPRGRNAEPAPDAVAGSPEQASAAAPAPATGVEAGAAQDDLGDVPDFDASPSAAMGIDPAAGPISRAAASSVDSQPDRLSPEEIRAFNNAYRRDVEDPLGELQGQVRNDTGYTTPDEVQNVSRAIEDAWLQANVAAEQDGAPAVSAAPEAPSPEQFGDPVAQVDAQLRDRRILSAVQNVVDGAASNGVAALNYLDGAMERIGEPGLSAPERERVQRVLDANAAFTGRTERAPLPNDLDPQTDLFAQNDELEALIPERKPKAAANAMPAVQRGQDAPAARSTFPSYEEAQAFIAEQRRAGDTRMQALPLPRADGSFGLAIRGTPDYEIAQVEQRQRQQRAAGVLEGDVLNKAGEIFGPKQRGLTRIHASRMGPGYAVVPVQGGFVARRSAAPDPAPDAVPAQVVQTTWRTAAAGGALDQDGRANTDAAELTATAAVEPAAPSPSAVDRPGLARMQAARAVRVAAADPAVPAAPAQQTQRLTGAPIDREWTAFAPDSGGKGIPRAEMPQIRAAHRGAMVQFLKGRGIGHTQETVAPDTLKPTQAEFSPRKVTRASGFKSGDRSILVSADGHVLDGHHQWMAKLQAGHPVDVIRLDAPIEQLVQEVRQFPSAAAAAGAQPAQQNPGAGQTADAGAAPGAEQALDAAQALDSERIAPGAAGAGQTAAPASASGSTPGQQQPAQPATSAQTNTSEPGVQQAPAPAPAGARAAASPAIQDFGEKLHGARKDYAAQLRDAQHVDIAAEPLSKSWPEPDYQKLLSGGTDAKVVALIRAARDEVPTKPQKSWRLAGWVEQTKTLRQVADDALSGRTPAGGASLVPPGLTGRAYQDAAGWAMAVRGRAELYEAVGHARSLKGVTFAEHHYSLYRGEANVRKWVVEQKAKATAFSNWPRELAVGDTREQALEQFQAKLGTLDLGTKAKGQTQFDIYRRRSSTDYIIGKKIGREQIDLKRFPDVAGARAFLRDSPAELETLLARYKETPLERRPENQPRVGDDHRSGAPVTPQAFAENFGFRGVQFGNYVEQGRRQSDLNEAYDALMDLAAVVGIPPRALSLNGRLGLAFGARGRGGKNAPGAHYEPDTVVINLTKGGGPGALAHEWWHSLDNYFGREGGGGGFVTDGAKADALRAEMQVAFQQVTQATQVRSLRERSRELDRRRSKPYWNTPLELSARAFESYVIAKLQDQNASNDYLANIVGQEAWDVMDAARGRVLEQQQTPTYPYPTTAEMPAVREAFDGFFRTVETRETDTGTALFRRNTAAGLPAPIAAAVQRITEAWANGPEVVIAQNMQDPALPARIRRTDADQREAGAAGSPQAVYFGGKVYLIADQISSERVAATALFHEALGHHGLRAVFGDSLRPLLTQLATLRRADVEAKAAAYGLDMADPAQRLQAAEEVLAEMAQTRPEIGWVRRAVAAIRTWLRENVPALGGLRLSDAEIVRNFLEPARGFVERGGSPATAMRTEPVFARGASSADRAQTDAQKARFLQGEPVAVLAGNEAPHGYPALRAWATKLFEEAGGKATHPVLGDVVLDQRAVKDSMGHGMNPFKAVAFAAVSDVLRNGVVVLSATANNVDSHYVSAPVQIGGKDDIVTVLVHRNPQTQRMYLHSVTTKESLLAQGVSSADAEASGRSGSTKSEGLKKDPPRARDSGTDAAGAASGYTGKVTSGEVASVLRHLLTLNPAAIEGDTPMFSRAAAGQVVTDLKRRAGNTLADYRGLAFSALGRRQIVEIYGKDLPQLAPYSELTQQMDADKNEAGAGADQIATAWGKLTDERELAGLMHDATLAQIDPAKPLQSGDQPAQYLALRRAYDALTPDAKKVYADARDTYRKHHEAVRSAIRDRIERSDIRGPRKAELLKQMDDEFFKAIKGVYFPLARFGDYVVVVRDSNGTAINVSRAETMNEAQALQATLRQAYPTATVGKVLKSKEFNAGRDAVGRGFMKELYAVLGKKEMDERQRGELEDMLGQLYLSALPDLSWAKHGIHRKGTPGYSQDARRAFAQNVFHGARYLAKVRYSDLLEDELSGMQKHVDGMGGVERYDSVKAQQVIDEMVKRHDAMMNPDASALSTALTSLGFVFHLGLSPASALVNLTQTAFVALPIMGSKWGFTKASAALLKASKETAAHRNDITSSLTTQEREAFDEAVRSGVIDVTMAHDLAGISQGEDAKVSWKLRPVMKWASFLFHHAEKFNRQVTFVAAYRLAREAGGGHQQAYRDAVKATYDGHFDYSAGNRPRLMQGNVARVVLLFKQYAQNMIYTLARQGYLAVKAEQPAERAEARKALGGLLAMHAAGAGVLGLPLVTTLLAAASMVGGSDDEPWDAEVAMRNMLADALGQKPAEVLMRGLSRLTPSDISGRVGLDKLILPDIQEGLEGQRLGESAMAAALGPVAGIGISLLKGLQETADGNWARGLETMAPSVLRGPLKALRYADQGVVDKSGKTVVEDVDGLGILGQAMGFSPSDVRLAYEGKSAIYQADQRLVKRRAELMWHHTLARLAGDEEAAAESQEQIQGFNQINPERRITAMNLAASLRARRRQIEQSEQGLYLPTKRRDAVEEGRFALEEE